MRYIVFAWYDFYPSGGSLDIQASFDSELYAQHKASDLKRNEFDKAEVYDTEEMAVIYKA